MAVLSRLLVGPALLLAPLQFLLAAPQVGLPVLQEGLVLAVLRLEGVEELGVVVGSDELRAVVAVPLGGRLRPATSQAIGPTSTSPKSRMMMTQTTLGRPLTSSSGVFRQSTKA
jgi:hypothetical protein